MYIYVVIRKLILWPKTVYMISFLENITIAIIRLFVVGRFEELNKYIIIPI